MIVAAVVTQGLSVEGQASTQLCAEAFAQGEALTAQELSEAAAARFVSTAEFRYLREQAEQRGLRVWLFGGTAASYLHYVKWDLERQKGLRDLQGDRFDYDFTNIFRSTQDLDIVVDASPEQARAFQGAIAQRYPHFLGAKAAWEVRPLRSRIGTPGQVGFKEALLGDDDLITKTPTPTRSAWWS